jgi:hypothetical protein
MTDLFFLHLLSTYPIMCLFLQIWVQPESVTKRLASAFNRLKIVNLGHIPEGYDLTWTMFILEAAPSLEEFYMTVCLNLKLLLIFFLFELLCYYFPCMVACTWGLLGR